MTIDLAKVEFDNDIFSTRLPDGGIITLNVVDESMQTPYDGLEIKGVNINLYDFTGELIECPCVIGLGNELMEIRTDYKNLEGKVLTPDNMMYCTIEVYE